MARKTNPLTILLLLAAAYVLLTYQPIVPPPDVGNLTIYRTDKIAKVWAIDDGEKVEQDAINYALATDYSKNRVWNGNKVSIFGAKNEIVAFQVMLQGASSGAQQVNVEFNNLSNSVYTIKNSPESAGDPYNYVGKNIELFVEEYHSIPTRTNVDWKGWSGSRALPDADFLGMLPDALIPFEAASSKGGAPFVVPANKLQGVWIDIYIPKNTPTGNYSGTIRVTANGQPTHDIPVMLQVYSFTIPDETHLMSWWYTSGKGESSGTGIAGKHPVTYGSAQYKTIEGRYFQMAHRHRMDLVVNAPVYDDAYTVDGMNIDQHFGRYITGQYYSSQYGYAGPGAGTSPPAWVTGIFDFSYWRNTSGKTIGFYPDTQARWWAAADEWVNWMQQHAPGVYFAKYIIEEPYTLSDGQNDADTMTSTLERIAWMNSNPGVGRNMEMIVGGWLEPRFFGLIDGWMLGGQSCYPVDKTRYRPDLFFANRSGYCLPDVNAARARGEQAGLYMGTRPNWGSVQSIDTQAIDPRNTAWVMWRYGIDYYYEWFTNQWGKSGAIRDVYADVYSNYGPGEAFSFYPGQQKDFAGTVNDKGLEGPVASIRMKSWRRGEFDYEYLWLAKQRGINTDAIVRGVVPRSFDEYGGNYTSQGKQPAWAQRGYEYDDARKQLAGLLGR